MFDCEQTLVFCNQQYLNFFKNTADVRIPGANLRDILRAAVTRGEAGKLSPDQAETWIAKAVVSLLVPGEQEFELDDGRCIQARASPSPDGSTMVVMTDISRRKKAESQLLSANKRLETLSRTDALTGLVNRRGFDEMLRVESARSQRSKSLLSLLFIDIDRFKAFNDRNGHPEGDEVLRRVGHCFQATMRRPSDLAARYGGEEFVALLPDTNEAGAVLLGETFRQAVRDLAIPTGTVYADFVTVSVGVATSNPGEADIEKTELLERADTALYEAKTSGRDRVRVWRPRIQVTA